LTENKGIYVANLTAFRGEHVDIDAMCAHAEFLVSAGVTGLCPAGTTGEFLYLNENEKKEIFSTLLDVFRERVKIICCTWDADSAAMARLCRMVSDKGADGIFLPPPIYYEFTEGEIISFYEFVRDNSAVPLYGYNIPKYSHNEISLFALERLINSKILSGLKDSSADEQRITQIVSRFARNIEIFAGGDHFVLRAKQLGAHGFISALANVYPEQFVRLWDTSDEEIAAQISRIRSIMKEYGGIPALKYLLSKRGFSFGCRFPFQELSKDKRQQLDHLL